MNDSSIITLKEEAVKNNIRFLKKKLGTKVRISSVVKANAYGHGIEQIVPLFEKEGIDHFSVFDFNEAKKVYKSLAKQATIMIMGWITDEKIKNAISIINMNLEHFVVKGFCTHLAGAESISNYKRIQNQLKKYRSMYSFLEINDIIPEYKDVA